MVDTPRWRLDDEYLGLDDPQLNKDEETVRQLIAAIKQVNQQQDPDTLAPRIQILTLQEAASTVLTQMSTYACCYLSTEANNLTARQLQYRCEQLRTELISALMPWQTDLQKASKEAFNAFISDPNVEPWRYYISRQRALAPFQLDTAREQMLTKLQLDGFNSWGRLYDHLTSTLACAIEQPDGHSLERGLAEVNGLLCTGTADVRERAYRARENAFSPHLETFAAILNALAGWRLAECQERSHSHPMHFLTRPCHDNHIREDTLSQLLKSVEQHRHIGQRAACLQAQAFKDPVLEPWNLDAPLPAKVLPQRWTFEQAINTITTAFASVSEEMGDFVQLMVQKRWIEAKPLPNKRTGAYCIHFPRSDSPRVFMTFNGSTQDLLTLTHELAHAFHSWSLKGQPFIAHSYPMTMAETASTFGESVLRQHLIKEARNPLERLNYLGQDVVAASTFLVNIPMRFRFEEAFYHEREQHPLSIEGLNRLMCQQWHHWYGPASSQANPIFWATKLHFSLTDFSFYNFPYLFGYLLAQILLGQFEAEGESFYPRYLALLQNSGKMAAEPLIQTYLGADITAASFWEEGLERVNQQLDLYAETLQTQGH